jgi:hypothetical protein
MSFEGVADPARSKTAVFAARVLWSFSEVHRVLGHAEAGDHAAWAKRFLIDRVQTRSTAGFFGRSPPTGDRSKSTSISTHRRLAFMP